MKILSKTSLIAFLVLAASFGCSELLASIQASSTIAAQEETLLSLAMKGGFFMIPLAICSLVGLAVAIERWITLSPRKIVPKDFFKRITNNSEIRDIDQIIAKCEKNNSAISKIIHSSLSKWKKTHNWELTEKTMEDTASRYVFMFKRSLKPLLHIGAIAPLLGLLGTIAGMIKAFQNVANVEQYGRAARLASGIYEAMVTTATGLLIAIPALIVYYYLADRMDKCADRIEDEANTFLDEFVHPNNK